MGGFYPNDPSFFAVQGKVSVDLFLFRGRSPPPCSNITYHNRYCKATAFCEEIQKEIRIVAPVCAAMRAATCSSSALGKPARFSAAKRFRMPQKSTFLSCIVFSLYPFSDGTNTDTVRCWVGVRVREEVDTGNGRKHKTKGEREEKPVSAFLPSGKKLWRGRSKACWSGPCRFHHLFSPIRHHFPDCWAINWSAAGAAHGNCTPPRISPSCTDCLYLSLCRSTIVGR